jgi:hypothetical protein
MTSDRSFPEFAISPAAKPPMPNHNKSDIEDVKSNHSRTLPKVKLSIPEKYHAETRRDDKESNIANKTPAGNLEWANQCHAPRNHGSYESCGAD